MDNVELKYSNNIITLYWNKEKDIKYEFYGKVNFGLIDNDKKAILIKFDDSRKESYDSTYKDMSEYGTESIYKRNLEEQSGQLKYWLDKDCELTIVFNDKNLNYNN